MEPVLSLEQVSFTYGKDWVLRGVDLHVPEGEVLGVLGPNGSGKSTLLRIMSGVIRPREGRVRIGGRDFSSLKRDTIAREIAVVSQEQHFRFEFTALEVVLMGRFPHLGRFEFEGKRDLEIAARALEATDTLGFADRSIHSLSGGEKQRVLIARALAQEPKLMLLDEPTSFLDLKHKRDIFRLVSDLSRERGLSVVLVSHEMDLASQHCRRLVLLKDGGISRAGTPDEVLTASNLESVFGCPVLVDRNPLTGAPRVSLA
ncbi:MAG: ABC transporter ATP-binding protein [Desulfobacteraceae bacterium]|nr:MAG: ABC transporter ATP-binding protein [Desulfobacteraceae bacterium]